MNVDMIKYIKHEIKESDFFVDIYIKENTIPAIQILSMIEFAKANNLRFNSIHYANKQFDYLFLKKH